MVIGPATVAMGLKRQQLGMEAELITDSDRDRLFLRRFTYPDLMASVVSQRGFGAWPITFDDYLDLPEQFAYDWEQAAYRHNPHWLPITTRLKEQQRLNADELHKRLGQMIRAQKEAREGTPELPESIKLNDLETSWRVWQLMEATGWHFPPSVVMAEPHWLLEDLLTISSQRAAVEKLMGG